MAEFDRLLVSPDDILAAARYRLRDWSMEQIEDGIDALARQDDPHADSAAPGMRRDGRNPFSASCALLALLASAKGDAALLYRAGYGVIDSYRQAERATGPRRGDALNDLIRQYLAEMPTIGPKKLWDDFKGQAIDGFNEILTDFDDDSQVLSYAPWRGAESEDIGFEAFRKRVQTFRKATVRG
ncbi:MAG: hypothetical protein NTZ79_17260 [Proteobacteria bacterium]|nr:hypothetical protein [Pseudomonadota bacterium]